MIRVLWPDCPARINSGGDSLLVSHGSAVRTDRIMKREKRESTKQMNRVPSDQAAYCPMTSHVALEIRARGRKDHLHREECAGLERAIRIGEKWFRVFEARNPWFVQDSKRKRIFILLDPETESLLWK